MKTKVLSLVLGLTLLANVAWAACTTSYIPTKGTGTAPRYFVCATASDRPSSGLHIGDLAIATDTGVQYVATSSTVWGVTGAASIPGEYGDGSDGVVDFDGTTTVLGLAPSSGTYTLTRDLWLDTGSQVSGTATLFLAGYRIHTRGTFTIGATATVHSNGNAAIATAGGAGGVAGTTSINQDGGAGSSSGSGSTSSNVSNPCLGGRGGQGGANSGGPGTGGGPNSGTCTLTTAMGLPRAVGTAHGTASFQLWKPGSGGGGGNAAASSPSGGGGASGGIVELWVYNLVINGILKSAGGNGAAASGSGSGAGGGGGGGGGAIILVYHTKSGTGSTLVAATNAPGGTGGAAQGAGTNGANGSNGVIYEVVH